MPAWVKIAIAASFGLAVGFVAGAVATARDRADKTARIDDLLRRGSASKAQLAAALSSAEECQARASELRRELDGMKQKEGSRVSAREQRRREVAIEAQDVHVKLKSLCDDVSKFVFAVAKSGWTSYEAAELTRIIAARDDLRSRLPKDVLNSLAFRSMDQAVTDVDIMADRVRDYVAGDGPALRASVEDKIKNHPMELATAKEEEAIRLYGRIIDVQNSSLSLVKTAKDEVAKTSSRRTSVSGQP